MLGCDHDIWVSRDTQTKTVGVAVANVEDSHYKMVLTSVEEVDEFIARLVDARKEAFGR